MLWPGLLQTWGKIKVEIRGTPKTFSQKTQSFFFLNHKFLKKLKLWVFSKLELAVLEEAGDGVGSLGASSLLPPTFTNLLLGHEVP